MSMIERFSYLSTFHKKKDNNVCSKLPHSYQLGGFHFTDRAHNEVLHEFLSSIVICEYSVVVHQCTKGA